MHADRQGTATSAGLLVLRVGIGGFMATHGWGKVQMVIDGRFAEFGDPVGIGSGPSLVLAAGAEFVCALLVVLGLATRLAALPPAITMFVAAFVAHGRDPWTMQEGFRRFMAKEAESWASREPALLFLIPFLALVLTGAGRFSLDALVGPRLRARRTLDARGRPSQT
jgi:putative oxidoreductase